MLQSPHSTSSNKTRFTEIDRKIIDVFGRKQVASTALRVYPEALKVEVSRDQPYRV